VVQRLLLLVAFSTLSKNTQSSLEEPQGEAGGIGKRQMRQERPTSFTLNMGNTRRSTDCTVAAQISRSSLGR
jgi:hypothetical protein